MQSLKELVCAGKQYFESKEYKKAEICLRKALGVNSNYADVLNMLGVIHHIDGKFSSAISYLKQALKVNPNYTEALLNLAVLYNDLGRYKEAKDLYLKLKATSRAKQKEIEPVLKGKLSNLHADVGDIYRSIGLYQHAIDEYKKALNLNKNYIDIRTKLGIAYRENKQLSESMQELKNVIKIDPNYVQAHIQAGITYYSMGQIQSAQEEWKKVLKKESQNEHAKMYLRLCQTMKSSKKAAKKK